jgi:hypothetical protein
MSSGKMSWICQCQQLLEERRTILFALQFLSVFLLLDLVSLVQQYLLEENKSLKFWESHSLRVFRLFGKPKSQQWKRKFSQQREGCINKIVIKSNQRVYIETEKQSQYVLYYGVRPKLKRIAFPFYSRGFEKSLPHIDDMKVNFERSSINSPDGYNCFLVSSYHHFIHRNDEDKKLVL